jgi:hypothetical protein
MVGVIDYHCINYAVYDTIKKVSTRPSRRGISKVETKGFYQVYSVQIDIEADARGGKRRLAML